MQWRKILQVSGTWSRSALCLCTTSRHFRDQPTKHTRNSGELGTLALEKLKTTNHGIFFFFHSDANHMTLWFWFRCPKPNNKKNKSSAALTSQTERIERQRKSNKPLPSAKRPHRPLKHWKRTLIDDGLHQQWEGLEGSGQAPPTSPLCRCPSSAHPTASRSRAMDQSAGTQPWQWAVLEPAGGLHMAPVTPRRRGTWRLFFFCVFPFHFFFCHFSLARKWRSWCKSKFRFISSQPQSPTFWGLGKFLNLAPPKWIQVKTASTRQKHVRQVAAAWHLTIRARGQQQTNLAIFRLCCLCTQTLPLWTDTHIFICWKPPADSGRPLFTFQHFGILRKQKRVLFAVISPTYVLTNCKSII